jgi:hypothetical protein
MLQCFPAPHFRLSENSNRNWYDDLNAMALSGPHASLVLD